MKHKGQHPRMAVIGTSLYDGSEYYFSSLSEAKQAGFTCSSISRCIKGIYKQSGGFTWRLWK